MSWEAMQDRLRATDPRHAAIRPYVEYLIDLGLDNHSAGVVREGGYWALSGKFVFGMDTWTAIRVDKILSGTVMSNACMGGGE